ncbi:ThuA-like domain-containing protein [Bombardia bombarda]|uniref:ThuA-like domain-containing protein n=1 Tax=Bombardia bombarda TaxID=252184 RepID=A0AA39WBB8_9PEZI|nr:ThuA-like domain-containing protein [Bombardia bombarda]
MQPFRVLIFSHTTAYRHASIPAGIRGIQRLASLSTSTRAPFTADATEDPAIFSPSTLPTYRVIVLLQCSGDFLSPPQLSTLQSFVRAGGGIVAIHCASYGQPSSPWYGRLIGAVFDNHPVPQTARVRIADANHSIIKDSLGRGVGMQQQQQQQQHQWEWLWLDEWYNFKTHPRSLSPHLHVLLTVDEASYAGGTHGHDHPVAWCHDFDGGRSFYTALGHFDEAYEDEGFIGQVLGGIMWAARALG